MKKQHKFLILFAALIILLTFVWQYIASKKTIENTYKPMSLEILLDPMNAEANHVVENSKYVYIGSSERKVTVESYVVNKESNQITLKLIDSGAIYTDSAFFAGQRLVFNTKIKIHALFDDVGTVTKLEYL